MNGAAIFQVGTPRCGVRFVSELQPWLEIADAAARRPYLWNR